MQLGKINLDQSSDKPFAKRHQTKGEPTIDQLKALQAILPFGVKILPSGAKVFAPQFGLSLYRS